jgi:hypothetical protein
MRRFEILIKFQVLPFIVSFQMISNMYLRLLIAAIETTWH